jgi:chaperonin cofactor prefoldin
MIQKLSNIADQLREREQILPEVQLVSKALSTLQENFRIIRTVWTSLPTNDRTLDHLLQQLKTKESVLKSYNKNRTQQ